MVDLKVTYLCRVLFQELKLFFSTLLLLLVVEPIVCSLVHCRERGGRGGAGGEGGGEAETGKERGERGRDREREGGERREAEREKERER